MNTYSSIRTTYKQCGTSHLQKPEDGTEQRRHENSGILARPTLRDKTSRETRVSHGLAEYITARPHHHMKS